MPKTMTKTSGAGARTGAVAEPKLLLGMVPGDQEPGARPVCQVLQSVSPSLDRAFLQASHRPRDIAKHRESVRSGNQRIAR